MFGCPGYDARSTGAMYDDEDSACPALLEREFHSLHRNVPGLRRAGVDTNAIRQVGFGETLHTYLAVHVSYLFTDYTARGARNVSFVMCVFVCLSSKISTSIRTAVGVGLFAEWRFWRTC